MPEARPDRDGINQGIVILHAPSQVVEVRIPKTRAKTVSGYFDDYDKMAAELYRADQQYRAGGVYYTLNEVNPALLGRAANRLKEHAEYTTSDADIVRRCWLPVDFDPIRPAGISSSDEEHEWAIERARQVRDDMEAEWGLPVLADSGNGAHLLYPIDLPNTPDSLSFVSGALAELHRRYSDDRVKVDVSCSNAARIWKAYGTVARKGDSIPGRPHRISQILEAPVS